MGTQTFWNNGDPVTKVELNDGAGDWVDKADPELLAALSGGGSDALATAFGEQDDTAATTDTGTFSFMAFVKRIAQRFTSLLALLPASLGQKTAANSLAVVVASDQSVIPHKYSKGTATLSRVQPAADATLLAANSSRLVALFQNVGSVDVYIRPGSGTAATTTNTVKLEIGKSFVDDLTTGEWRVIPASGTGDVRIIEVA